VGGGEQQRSCSPETSLQLQRYGIKVEEIQCVVTRELNNVSKTTFQEGMEKFMERANKFIDQGGMYFEE
jgi:Cu/Ag efflux pump CusA